jgi:hypothetical protein
MRCFPKAERLSGHYLDITRGSKMSEMKYVNIMEAARRCQVSNKTIRCAIGL